ncbi:MAG: ATP-binding cassette domain-containing protein [Burkholderiaceae bacterium]
MADTVLAVRQLSVSYGRARAIEDVSLELGRGEMLALIGANGAGKSTLFKAIVGLIPAGSGDITFNGQRIDGLLANEIVARGIAMVPEGRRLFRSLSVEENLVIGGQIKRPGRGRSKESTRCSRCSENAAISRPRRCRAGSSRWSPSGGH